MNLTYKLLHVVQWEFSKDTIFFNMPHSKTLKLGKINVLSCDLTMQRQTLFVFCEGLPLQFVCLFVCFFCNNLSSVMICTITLETVTFQFTGKKNRFPLLDILGYLKNTRKNPKFGKVRQVPTREFPTKFLGWEYPIMGICFFFPVVLRSCNFLNPGIYRSENNSYSPPKNSNFVNYL